MVSISDTTLPGASATIDSATSVSVNVSSPGDVALVGEADTANNEANDNTVYRVTTPIRARQLFGTGTPLAENIVHALGNGAFPVYAAAAQENNISDEDVSGIGGTSGTLANGPVLEDQGAAVFTVDGTAFDTILTLDDPETKSPGSQEVYLNPVTAEFELGQAPSTSADVEYTYLDYAATVEEVKSEYGNVVDFIASTTENATVVGQIETAVDDMVQQKEFAIGVAGAMSYLPVDGDDEPDTSLYNNPHDTSRLQIIYPARNEDGDSIIGSYLGLRGAIGLQASAMQKRLRDQTSLADTLTRQEKIDLDAENVVVLSNEAAGALVENDPTCVAADNDEEAEMRDGLSRMIVDYVTETVLVASEGFIGDYHSPATRNQLRSVLRSKLSVIQDTDAILNFTVAVEETDAYTARVDLGVETVKPLRNVVANITAGEVGTGAVAVSA